MKMCSRAYPLLRSSLIATCLSLLLASLANNIQAQTLTVQVSVQPPDLQCPTSKPAARPTTAPTPIEELYEIPEEDLLLELIKSLPHPTTNTEGAISLFSKLPKSRPLHIGLWGDSHAAANFFAEELIQSVNLPKDKVLPRFIPPTLARGGVRLPLRKQCQGQGWKYDLAYVGGQEGVQFSRGMARLNTIVNNSYQWIDFRTQGQQPNLRGVDILYAASTMPTTLGLTIDQLPEQLVELKLNQRGAIQIQAQGGLLSTLKLRLVKGSLSLEGFVPSYAEQARLYFDTLAIPGATARSWKLVDPEYFKALGNQTPYDVVLLQYGTNEGNQKPFSPETYENDLTASLQNLRRIYPDAICVLLGPTDRGTLIARSGKTKSRANTQKEQVQDSGAPTIAKELLVYSRIHEQISRIQQTVSQQYGCGFWDWQQAMGGPGGSYAWLKQKPTLMARDLIHLTVAGYQESARLFSQEMHFGEAFK
ncbi:MAG: GDSL-type esterase/lipase family protein [Alcaligenaceae bacterium]